LPAAGVGMRPIRLLACAGAGMGGIWSAPTRRLVYRGEMVQSGAKRDPQPAGLKMTVGSGCSRAVRIDSPNRQVSLRECLKSAQQVEMLCKLRESKEVVSKSWIPPPLPFLQYSCRPVWAPMAQAQANLFSEQTDGKISGTVLLKANNRPASQVAVKLKIARPREYSGAS